EVSEPCIDPEVEPQNNAPEIVAPTEAALNFSATQGEVVTVKAEDLDAGDTLIFSITETAASEDADQFIIDAQTGQVWINGNIQSMGSADGDSTYEIEVEVTDGKDVDTILLELTYEQVINQQGAPMGM
ncbi:MAG: cadherin repeat domain-containing protein, partial [Pseudomonadota bacterium]